MSSDGTSMKRDEVANEVVLWDRHRDLGPCPVCEMEQHVQTIKAQGPVARLVQEGNTCSEGHEAEPMALCYDSGHQNGFEAYYWYCVICTRGIRAVVE